MKGTFIEREKNTEELGVLAEGTFYARKGVEIDEEEARYLLEGWTVGEDFMH